MSQQGELSATGLVAVLEVSKDAVIGLPMLVTLRVINRGKSPVTISARLNLMEGDVRLLVTGPDGTKRVITGAGGQPDTALRQVTLLPGQQIVDFMNLLYTNVGATFPEPGKYVLLAEYAPSPRVDWISSEPVSLTIRSPQNEAEQDAAALLQKEKARRALTLAEADSAPDELRELATGFPDSLGGKLARLVLAGSSEAADTAADLNEFFRATDPLTAASLIRAVSTPFSRVGERLAEGFAAYLESQETTAKTPDSPESVKAQRALRIAKGQPLEGD